MLRFFLTINCISLYTNGLSERDVRRTIAAQHPKEINARSDRSKRGNNGKISFVEQNWCNIYLLFLRKAATKQRRMSRSFFLTQPSSATGNNEPSWSVSAGSTCFPLAFQSFSNTRPWQSQKKVAKRLWKTRSHHVGAERKLKFNNTQARVDRGDFFFSSLRCFTPDNKVK
jgi:hypothetical protein